MEYSSDNVKKSANVMGYPSMNNNYPQIPPGYPTAPYQVGYVQPYQYHQGYPPPNSKFQSSPSFNMMYGQNYGPTPWMPEQNNSNIHKFGRFMLSTMIILIIIMFILSMVIWFLFGAEVPIIQVRSFSVSNFTVMNHTIQGNWDVNVTVLNPNTHLRVNSGVVHVIIVYQNVPLATSFIDPICVEGNQQYSFQFKMNNVKRPCEEVLESEITKDQSSGTLFLGLQLGLGAKFTTTTIWRKESLKVYCEDLKIDLASNGTVGALSHDSTRQCLLFA